MDNLTQRLRQWWRINWCRRSLISLGILLIVLLLIPLGIQFGITHWLGKQGALNARIDDINLNPFAGHFEITRLSFDSPASQHARLDHLIANINMLGLLRGRIVLDELTIDGLQADIQRDKDDIFRLNGLMLNKTDNAADIKPNASSKPLAYGINHFSVSNSQIHYREKNFNPDLLIHTLKLDQLQSWNPQSHSNLALDVLLNDTPIQFNTTLDLFSPDRKIEGTLKLDRLATEDFKKFYPPALNRLNARVSLTSNLTLEIGQQINASLDNRLEITDFDARYEYFQPAFDKLLIEGKSRLKNIAPDHLIALLKGSRATTSGQILELFNGKLSLQKLSMTDNQKHGSRVERIDINDARLDALAAHYVIGQIHVSGLQSQIHRTEDGKILIDGISLPETDQAAAVDTHHEQARQPAFELGKLTIDNSDIDYSENTFSQRHQIDRIELSNINTADKHAIAQLIAKARINGAPLQLQAQLTLFDEPRKASGKLSIKQLAIGGYQKFAADYVSQLQGTLSLKSQFDFEIADKLVFDISHQFTLTEPGFRYQDVKQHAKAISGKGRLSLKPDKPFELAGNIDIEQFASEDLDQHYLIAAFDHLSIDNFQHDNGHDGFDRLKISLLKVSRKKPQDKLIELKSADIKQAEFQAQNQQLTVAKIRFDKPDIKLTLNDKKQLLQLQPLLKTLTRLIPAPPAQPSSKKQAATPVDINIESLTLGQPGTIDFEDHSVSPLYKTRLTLDKINIQSLSNKQDGHFDFALQQGDYTKITSKGVGLLLKPTQTLSLNANIRQLDLPPITPYTSHYMGYGMKSGVVDSTIKLKLVKRNIDALVDLKIDSIEVVETNQKTAEQVTSAAGMSLDLAISSLKDKNNVIDLKLPIKGNIDEPDFDLSLIFNQAMGKAMKATTLAYLKNSLQPFGSLITLYSLAKAAADHISLPPLLFKPNSTEYQPGQQALLEKVIKVLAERPGLKIKTCGISSLTDQKRIQIELIGQKYAKLEKTRLANKKATSKPISKETIEISDKMIQQKMIELADHRAAKVKADFVKLGKLEPSRILNCLSSKDTGDKAKPSVQLML